MTPGQYRKNVGNRNSASVLTATAIFVFCYNIQTFQSDQRSDGDETASFFGLGRCDLYDHGHGHRLQAEIRERKYYNESLYETGLLCGRRLFGSFGVKLLSSKDAKKAYVHVTAAGLRMKDSVMGTVTTVQENAAEHSGLRQGAERGPGGKGSGGSRRCQSGKRRSLIDPEGAASGPLL